jgi:hypothetical protein
MNSIQGIPSYSPVTLAAALTPKGTARLQPNAQRSAAAEAQDPPAAAPRAASGGIEVSA